MGLEINRIDFDYADRRRFAARLECSLGVLANLLDQPGFGERASPTVLSPSIIVSSGTRDPDPLNNLWSTTVQAVPPPPPSGSADLAILKLDSLDPVLAGTRVDYDMAIFNNGPGSSSGVVAIDPLPAGALFDSVASDPPGVCSACDHHTGNSHRTRATQTAEEPQVRGAKLRARVSVLA